MAYKFQLGSARLSGSTVFEQPLSTLQSFSAQSLSSSGDLDIGGEVQLDGVTDHTATASDHLYFRDSSGLVRMDQASDVRDLFFSVVSGDATVAAGGALTIAADAVEGSMLNDNVISAQAELGHADIVDADELMISDGGTLKKVGVDSLRDHFFGVVSGDATVADGGALTIAAGAVEGSMLNANVPGLGLHLSGSKLHLSASVAGAGLDYAAGVLKVNIDGLGALGGASLAQGDHLLISDGGAEKKITFSNLEDSIFGNVSGDATVAAGGALTIAAGAVEHGMLAEDIISGQDELAHADIADADELMISDAGVIKRVGVDSLRDHFFGVVSGDATVADGGALTIAADAVEGSMLNDNVISGQDDIGAALATTDELLVSDGGTIKRTDLSRFSTMLAGTALQDDSGQLRVKVSGSMSRASGFVGLSGSIAGAGLSSTGNVNAIETLFLDIDGLAALGSKNLDQTQDKFLFSDNGTEKTVTFSNLQDAIFNDVSGQAAIADGGALSLDVAAITAQTEMTGDVADTDELMISDGGALKRLDFSVLRDAVFSDVSGDATVAAGGALTIGANAVEDSMLNDNVATGLAGVGLGAASGVLAVDLNELSAADVAVSADSIAIIDATDNVSKKESIADLMAAVAGTGIAASNGVLSVPNSGVTKQDFSSNFAASIGYNAPDTNTMTGAITVTMPAPAAAAGAKVVIKAPATCSDSNTVTITGATMDGQSSIVLEGPGAAVTLINIDVAGDSWIIV